MYNILRRPYKTLRPFSVILGNIEEASPAGPEQNATHRFYKIESGKHDDHERDEHTNGGEDAGGCDSEVRGHR